MPPVDIVTVNKLQDTDEQELAELIELFAESAPASIDEMWLALSDSNPPGLTIAAHTLKGSCSNWGPSPLRELCAEI